MDLFHRQTSYGFRARACSKLRHEILSPDVCLPEDSFESASLQLWMHRDFAANLAGRRLADPPPSRQLVLFEPQGLKALLQSLYSLPEAQAADLHQVADAVQSAAAGEAVSESSLDQH